MHIAVSGGSGKMGAELVRATRKVFAGADITVVDRNKPSYDMAVQWSRGFDFQAADLVIDFSRPELTNEAMSFCKKHAIALVVGTTGLSEDQLGQLKNAGAQIPLFYSPNMSVGIAIVKKALQTLAQLPNADVYLQDFHHNQKVDSPSGTALHLVEELKKQGVDNPQVSAHRVGGIFGTHRVGFVTDDEAITITHEAFNRRVFAGGAVAVAAWLLKQQPGFYQMPDYLA